MTTHQTDTLSNLKEGEISAPVVMKSAAGYYVGTYVMSDGLLCPNERFSDYMCEEDAKSWLATGIATESL